jgi:hypothetical protein
MQTESAMSKALEKLGETDRLLAETSTLPDEIKEKITQRLAELQGRLDITAILGTIMAIVLAACIGLLVEMAPTADFSKEADKYLWGRPANLILFSLAFLLVDSIYVLFALTERSALRQKLIHGK